MKYLCRVCKLKSTTWQPVDLQRIHPSGKSNMQAIKGDSVCSGNVSPGIECTSCCSRLSPTDVNVSYSCHLFLCSHQIAPLRLEFEWVSEINWPCQSHIFLSPLPKAPQNSQTFDLAENHGIIWAEILFPTSLLPLCFPHPFQGCQ